MKKLTIILIILFPLTLLANESVKEKKIAKYVMENIQKDYVNCLISLKKVAKLEPTSFDVLCKILCLERQICDWSREPKRVEKLTEQIIELSERDHSRPAPSTFSLLNLIDDAAFQLRATRNYTREKVGDVLRAPFPEYKKPVKKQKIKISKDIFIIIK